MKKILFAILLILTSCSNYSHKIYTAPNNAFNVEVPYQSHEMRDALAEQQGNNVQYVDFAYAKYYPELGFQTIEWLDNEDVKTLHIRDKEHMKKVFKRTEGERVNLISTEDNFHCESKNINGYDAFQCNELVKFKDPKKNYMDPNYFSMTVIYFNQGVAVAYSYGSLKIHDEFVNSIHALN